ncbi:type I toxin-antitoxin system Fst family toxin [Staphylococcus edaphicus]|uniref:Type I toxin-antitoxin system Fst family toxin n=1 Tax=Staphylococcus edaphicus TaxID=1955013 RepID=A0ABY4QHG6_9STAP|nr:type I toxin-antitoxin system Fst family toxin [Staphylococcus edaphicus]UQW82811.1 type I toxin-antitoxin system Fst family toxin [Staphylococcus edaphicus]
MDVERRCSNFVHITITVISGCIIALFTH